MSTIWTTGWRWTSNILKHLWNVILLFQSAGTFMFWASMGVFYIVNAALWEPYPKFQLPPLAIYSILESAKISMSSFPSLTWIVLILYIVNALWLPIENYSRVFSPPFLCSMSEFVGKKMSSIVHFVASLNAEKNAKKLLWSTIYQSERWRRVSIWYFFLFWGLVKACLVLVLDV